MAPTLAVRPQELLETARRHVLFLGNADASGQMGLANAAYGMGKIISCLQRRSIPERGTVCVFTPDGGITRNKERWQSGFGYGCYLRWPSPEEAGTALMFPQIKPNACGVLVCRIDEAPTPEELASRLRRARAEGLALEGTSIKFNLGVSNHFIEVCRAGRSDLPYLPEGSTVAVIHNSPSEFKKHLYDYDMWESWGGEWENTPLGRIFVLEGELALAYYDKFREIDLFGKAKRLQIAREIFSGVVPVCNPTHQGMFSPNVARLGLYDTADTGTSPHGEPIFPLTLRWDLPIYLIRGRPNLEPGAGGSEFRQAAEAAGVSDLVAGANMLPHGGGYSIPFTADRWLVTQEEDARFFHLHNNGRRYIFSNPSELPYSYRGLEVLEQIKALRLGEVAAELHQMYTMKY